MLVAYIGMLPPLQLDEHSDTPLYRQLYSHVRTAILAGTMPNGERLPATRELAGQLGLNRTTVSAAYELLIGDGLISGHVGRGSFVSYGQAPSGAARGGSAVNWQEILNPVPAAPGFVADAAISFVASRPSERLFPVEEFRRTCQEVIGGGEIAGILQLGTPAGYAPLRRYLLERAREEGSAQSGDDIVITSGCQQAFDLLRRAIVSPGDSVAIEDPVYPGLRNAFAAGGARLVGVPVYSDGMDLDRLGHVLRNERPRAVVVTSSFQNPTGTTLPMQARTALVELVREHRAVLIESDIYGELRYEGQRIPPIKTLDGAADAILLRSFSKTAFPGLRVGWIIGPREVTRRVAEAKQWCDLHTDQLSQAVLLRFAESGRLAAHLGRMLEAGRERLGATLGACERHLSGVATWTRPEGGMSVWVTLPDGVDTAELLPRAQREGVAYLPGKFFAVGREHRSSARLSFAGLTPEQIEQGIAILGRVFGEEARRVRSARTAELEPALV